MNCTIVMYHYTRDLKHSRYPEIKGLDVQLFRQQLEFFKANYNVIQMEQLIAAVKSGEPLPEKALLLTFDDGYIDNYTFALPLLEEFGFQGSFFIPGKTFTTHQLLDVNKIHYILASTDAETLMESLLNHLNFYRGTEFDYPSNDELFEKYAVANRFDPKEIRFIKRVLQTGIPEAARNKISSDLFKKHVGISEEQLAWELYMTEDQIRTLKRHGMFIGIHGYDHYWLGNLPDDKMREDVDKAIETLSEFIDKDAWVMNFPYGSYAPNVLDYIAQKGAAAGLTIEPGVANFQKDNPLALPRFDCNDFPPKSENYKNFKKDR